MRRPRHKRALRELEASLDALTDEDVPVHATRQAIPPTDWEDITVSYTRGQEWSRRDPPAGPGRFVRYLGVEK